MTMISDIKNKDQDPPVITIKTDTDLTDYFCPFCGHKLFRGKVASFNMVCSNCNRLASSRDIRSDNDTLEK